MIVNPRSQGGGAGRDWPRVADRIRRQVAFEHVTTTARGDATRLARQALRDGAERVVALGGDGTINEVMNGFFDEAGAPVAPGAALGILPYGTGGDLRKTLGIPKDLDAAIGVLAADHRRRIDVGRIEHVDDHGRPAVRRFCNIASLGMSAEVDVLVNQSSKRFGKLSYMAATVRGMARYDNQRVRLTFDDDPATALELTVNTVAIANGRYFGGGMKMAPDAEPDDGLFDVVAIGDVGMFEMLRASRRLYAGTHVTRPEVSVRRARRVLAEPAADGAVVGLDVDGETPGRLPATFTVEPGALAVVVPAR